jgi:GNAT superfamily N-acetyltransferase
MRVRALTPDDAQPLSALRLRALKDHPRDFGAAYEEEAPWPIEKWRQSLAETRWFGVEREGVLCGCAILRIPTLVKLAHNGWIHAMYIAPEARGAGAGEALIAAIEAFARVQGVLVLKLLATQGNDAAVRLYAKCGFQLYGVEPASHKVDGVLYDSIEMIKRIDR